MMGLPANWTSSLHTADADPAPQDPGRFVNTSLFSGVGGIELGTHAAFATATYVECNEEAKAVLEKRISDAHLHEGVFVNKVEDLREKRKVRSTVWPGRSHSAVLFRPELPRK